jgi:hypothetical protein
MFKYSSSVTGTQTKYCHSSGDSSKQIISTKVYINKNDTLHQIYSNQKIKQQLIDYIYSIVDLSKYKFTILKTIDDLPLLQTNKFHISGNYTGTPSLLVFTTNKGRTYSFIVSKKMLSYRKSQINIDTIILDPIEVGLDEHIYDGTIMDGIVIQNDTQESSKTFIIADMYYFRGEDVTHDKLKYKLIQIKKYLDACLNQDKNLNNITLTVNNLYDVSEIETLANKIIPESPIPVRGITFYPDVSGMRLIYLFNDEQHSVDRTTFSPSSGPSQIQRRPMYHQATERSMGQTKPYYEHKRDSYRDMTESREFSQSSIPGKEYTDKSAKVVKRYVRKQDITEQIVITFELRKTEQSDVYKLLLVAKQNEDGKIILKTRNIGIAYIPTISCSRMCRDATMINGRALVKCQYDDDKEKWIPIECDTKKKCPDLIDVLESKMDLIIDEE